MIGQKKHGRAKSKKGQPSVLEVVLFYWRKQDGFLIKVFHLLTVNWTMAAACCQDLS